MSTSDVTTSASGTSSDGSTPNGTGPGGIGPDGAAPGTASAVDTADGPPASTVDSPELAAVTNAPTGNSVSDYVRNYIARIRGGDMGSLPAVTGLVVLLILFRLLDSSFGGLFNTAVLLTEGSGPMFIAMGLVFVLLLGEIDLSAGYAAGVCAAVMVRIMVGHNAPWPVSVGAALLTGMVIGLVIGLLRAKLRIPSFVVTLAFFLAFQGIALYILNNGKGQHGNVSVTDPLVNGLINDQMPLWGGWLFAAICVALYAAMKISRMAGRARAGLSAEPNAVIAFKIAAVAALVFGLVYILNLDRSLNKNATGTFANINGKLVKVPPVRLEGVPWVIPIIVFFLVVWTFVLARTRYGRHVYAVGGNEEAARRAGIPVDRIRVSVFVINSFMAAIGGIMIASNVKSVSVDNYGGNTLLLAVGAAVIGGTSLFGGKGRIVDAVIGGMVVEVIYNGMSDLVKGTNGAAVQYVITGLVLLLAAAVDALAQRRSGT